MRPKQNGRHFANDILKSITLNKNIWISIEILQIFSDGPIDQKSSLGQIMVCRRTIIWTDDGLVYSRIYVSLGIKELTHIM